MDRWNIIEVLIIVFYSLTVLYKANKVGKILVYFLLRKFYGRQPFCLYVIETYYEYIINVLFMYIYMDLVHGWWLLWILIYLAWKWKIKMCIASLINCLLALYLVIHWSLPTRSVVDNCLFWRKYVIYCGNDTKHEYFRVARDYDSVHLGSLPRFMKDLCQDN